MFSREFGEISKNTFSTEHLLATASYWTYLGSGESATVLFSATTKTIDIEIISYLVQVYPFQLTFFGLLIGCEDCRRGEDA